MSNNEKETRFSMNFMHMLVATIYSYFTCIISATDSLSTQNDFIVYFLNSFKSGFYKKRRETIIYYIMCQ